MLGDLDVLVANAGGLIKRCRAVDTPLALWEEVMAVNLTSTFLCCRAALKHMEPRKKGNLILISSLAVREPSPNLALTNAVRPGVVGYMKSLANELGRHGITVNSVAPGRIMTARLTELYGADGPPADEVARIPAGRLGEPRELGDLVAFLCSTRASYISGTHIPVDGGLYRGLL